MNYGFWAENRVRIKDLNFKKGIFDSETKYSLGTLDISFNHAEAAPPLQIVNQEICVIAMSSDPESDRLEYHDYTIQKAPAI